MRDMANEKNAMWKLDLAADAKHILQKEKELKSVMRKKDAAAAREGNPEKSVIESIRVKVVDNQMPVHVAVSIPSVDTRLYDAKGRNFAFVMGAGEQSRPSEIVYSSDSVMKDPKMKEWGHLTESSLHRTYAPYVDGKHYIVLQTSPIITVMQRNPKLWQSHLKAATYYKDANIGTNVAKLPMPVVNKVADEICAMLRELPHVDMTQFGVKFLRADGLPWDDATGVASVSGTKQEQQRVLDRKYNVSLEIEVTHVLTS